jgi:beta-lactamase class C
MTQRLGNRTWITAAPQIFGPSMRTFLIAIAAMFVTGLSGTCVAMSDSELERLITREIAPMVDDVAGAAIAVRMDGRTTFFNYGMAERVNKRPVTSDTLFNIASMRKIFEATLLAEAANLGELGLSDRVADYVPELRQGEYISRVTLGQLASHTSGLLLPTDHPPWPDHRYSLSDFLRDLNTWTPGEGQEPGKQHTYSHAGYVLLQLALERRFATPIAQLLEQRIFKPLGLLSTGIPATGVDGRGQLEPAFMDRAVQGFSVHGNPIGAPGDQQGFFDFAGTGQIFSSARDLAIFLAAELGELPIEALLRDAMARTQHGLFVISPRHTQALAWEINDYGGPVIIDKPGGLNNASTSIGMVTAKRLGIVILVNRGDQYPHEAARERILPALAQ